MSGHRVQDSSIIFWGAGATRSLGIKTTVDQERFLLSVTDGSYSGKQLKARIAEALGDVTEQHWHDALFDLICILGDSDSSYDSISSIDEIQLSAMRRNWRKEASDQELRERILRLRLMYDWPALKSVVKICPGSTTGSFKLNDLFNLLDMHIPPGFGVRAPARQSSERTVGPQQQFFDTRRLVGAKNALLLTLIASFYIDYQTCIAKKSDILGKYCDFAKAVGRRMQRQAAELCAHYRLDEPAFYEGDLTFVSLNYDPIALWVQFVANRELNNSVETPRIKGSPLHLFHDFGHLIPARRISHGDSNWPWYPLNEGAAQRLNELSSEATPKVRLTKFLFPHGCLSWRECPDCGKLSAYHGDEWTLGSPGLFPPPPLLAFDTRGCPDRITVEERDERNKGAVDARQCLHCGTLTYAHHTQTLMQSSVKPTAPSFIEEIQRELRATTMQANHIIFMGYSLPQDDVTYRAFFSARLQRGRYDRQPVRCSVIGKDDAYSDWCGPAELSRRNSDVPAVVRAAREIFGPENVRFYGGGVPDVFLEHGQVTEARIDNLLVWSDKR